MVVQKQAQVHTSTGPQGFHGERWICPSFNVNVGTEIYAIIPHSPLIELLKTTLKYAVN